MITRYLLRYKKSKIKKIKTWQWPFGLQASAQSTEQHQPRVDIFSNCLLYFLK